VNYSLRSFIQTAVDLNLRGIFLPAVIGISTLENGIAGAFLRTLLLLGTHRLGCCLDGAMRATSVALRHDGDLLDTVLASTGAGGDPTG